ncbi:MAG: hypothetical protein NC920_00895 [Candidatus Omnitrophica bacterium]|nr:hypothetical protein [Candidatus Omnitrophota bacterium]
MRADLSILILGEGRISQAVFYYLKSLSGVKKVEFSSSLSLRKKIRDYSLIISALPAQEARRGLELALSYKKNLLDISDLDPPFYWRKRREIEKAEILVIPGCGFSPGLVNFIVGREIFRNAEIDSVVIKAGSLARKRFFFPFLWCFEDLIHEHRLPSYQIISGKKVKYAPFTDYRKEEFLKIPAESYFSVSGFENIFAKRKFFNFHFRVVRPRGFMNFFRFLDNYHFLNKQNLDYTRNLLEGTICDNYTLALIELGRGKRKFILWEMCAFSRGKELFNSMQKITALFPVVLCKTIFLRGTPRKGIIFVEELGKEETIFAEVLKEARDKGIILRRSLRC